jgi:Glyoxalase/Bleomycin resistance protein/Dioxygenase superfamily
MKRRHKLLSCGATIIKERKYEYGSVGIDMSDGNGPIRSISELALWVRDLERSVAFYRDGLGFVVEDIDPGKNAFLRGGDFLRKGSECPAACGAG